MITTQHTSSVFKANLFWHGRPSNVFSWALLRAEGNVQGHKPQTCNDLETVSGIYDFTHVPLDYMQIVSVITG
jgi:hypothetical protein